MLLNSLVVIFLVMLLIDVKAHYTSHQKEQ